MPLNPLVRAGLSDTQQRLWKRLKILEWKQDSSGNVNTLITSREVAAVGEFMERLRCNNVIENFSILNPESENPMLVLDETSAAHLKIAPGSDRRR
jgi:hypothetical protein